MQDENAALDPARDQAARLHPLIHLTAYTLRTYRVLCQAQGAPWATNTLSPVSTVTLAPSSAVKVTLPSIKCISSLSLCPRP